MNKRLKIIVSIALFAALAALMYSYLRFPLLVPFYKIDFSESIVMLGSLILGPIPGIIIQTLKNLIKVIMSGSNSAGIGDLADFISGIMYILPAVIFYKKNVSKKNLIISLIIGSIVSTLVACVINYYFMLPMFASEETIIAIGSAVFSNIKTMFDFVFYITAPFNIIKCALNSIVVIIVENRLKILFNKKLLK